MGYLPPGLHQADWQEFTAQFTARFAYNNVRIKQANGLLEAIKLLKQAGCHTVYVDGSYVTDKQFPGDFDACWELDGVKLELLDPVFLRYEFGARAMTSRFGGQLFPLFSASLIASTDYLSFFSTDRQNRPKGVIVIDLETLP